jgi:FtsP/CotA-like multicopper oxidase with cupredoxin domain
MVRCSPCLVVNEPQWEQHQALWVWPGQRVQIEFVNRTVMAHPMHLHGHRFQVVKINRQASQGARRDTVLVPPKRSVIVAFDANKRGRWALNCHSLYHMLTDDGGCVR